MMKNLSIRIKYALPTAILTLALLAVVIADNMRFSTLEQNMNRYTEVYLPAVSAVLNGDRDLYQVRVALVKYVSHDAKHRPQLKETIADNAQQASDRFISFRQLMRDYPDIQQSAQGFEQAFSRWNNSVDQVLTLSNDGDKEGALAILDGEGLAAFSALRDVFDVSGELAMGKATLLKEQAAATNQQQKTIGWVVLVSTLAISLIVAFVSQRILVTRITEVTERIEEISSDEGDLTAQIKVSENDEIGDLAKAFNHFVQGLGEVVHRIDADVDALQRKSEVLDESALKTSQVAVSQSTSSDTILSAVHQMSLATKEMADNASEGAALTTEAIAHANEGIGSLTQAVARIEELYQTIETTSSDARHLAEESTNIASVLEVIRGIAEQTNLLALNAAIEAARAGEKGRGFAVVADEVRNLAQKTQDSTDSIETMIATIQQSVTNVVSKIDDGFDKVSTSVELSKQTETTLIETSELLTKVNDMSIQAASATEQQTAAAADIKENLVQLNSQVQTNRSVAEHTHLTAEEVRQLAANIAGGISRFSAA
ncbi:methyl-accepting chemotaxis protein [Thaumasiovibrio subtropicus]|uniref:methyl-accepting chemotaxis protein n=1 Tax=Thaumasiovibrio subtropicus TaxID=1891207 RepID=UPI000B360E6C|nr:methyl-accepting chemotaxis protein [Thaumasiovibrio subtropicus]